MSEDLIHKIKVLETELKVVKLASMQWEEIQRTYQKSNDRLQQVYNELSLANDRFSLAFDASQMAWWDWDCKTGRIECSSNMASLIGLLPGSVPASISGFMELIHPGDAAEVKDKLEKHLHSQTPYYEAEYRSITEKDGCKWVFDKGKVVETDIVGKPSRMIGVKMDVERKKVHETKLLAEFEKADEANKAKSLFLANMSHEIYTPLSGVVGMAEILRQSELSPEQKEYLGIIEDSATNLLSVFNAIMDFLKIEAGQIELNNTVFSVYDVIEDVISDVLPEAREKELEILSFVDANIPMKLKGDPSRLKQVLRVFADNGIKFTESGEISISAYFLSWDEDTVSLQFKVSDTGIGISEEAQKKIFTSFTRIIPSTGKYGGSGLGLAIARHLISRMKGEINVESLAGKGSTFTFTVQLEKVPGSEAPAVNPGTSQLNVLIIDPYPVRARILIDFMNRFDCESQHLLTLTDGLQEISHRHKIRRPFDFVVVELEAAKLALGAFKPDPAWNELHKLLVAYHGQEIPKNLAGMAFGIVLYRPFLPMELSAAMEKVISKSTPESTVKERSRPQPKPESRNLKILLAEDNLINQKVAVVTLSKLGHQIDVAENGRQAVELFKKNKYDLILMDIFMPEQDGLEATKEIRGLESASHSIPPIHICAITANADKDDKEKCLQSGVDSYITKPFKMEELFEILNSLR
ncbi:MAG: response regulator [Bacteroidota bacterium]